MSDFYSQMYNPDILTCLANLSNDEVFTPPKVVNQMLDMLPEELWHDSGATFLDPACKSGVFLREIAKRLIEGLKEEIPDLQKRVDRIFQKQLYGIAITELTSLLSRRSVYCSKYPNSQYSITLFEDIPTANIPSRFLRTPAAIFDTSGYRIAGRTANACSAVLRKVNTSEGTNWKPMLMSGYIRLNRRRYLR